MSLLRVSDDKRYLVHDDGRPFFHLGETAGLSLDVALFGC